MILTGPMGFNQITVDPHLSDRFGTKSSLDMQNVRISKIMNIIKLSMGNNTPTLIT